MIGVRFSTGVIGLTGTNSTVAGDTRILLVSFPVVFISTCGCNTDPALVAAVALLACERMLLASRVLLDGETKLETCDGGNWGICLGAWDVCGCVM